MTAQASKPLRLLIVSETGQWPFALRELVDAHGIRVVQARDCRQASDPALLSAVDAVILCDAPSSGHADGWRGEFELLADALTSHRLSGIVLSPGTTGVVPGEGDALVSVAGNVSAAELWGRVATIRQYRPLLMQMEEQVSVMQRLGKKLNQHFVEVDQELRLASRLQRDFLPKCFPEVGDIRFAALFRPATWVSGDVYDVRRLDETHVNFYLADAVGHGVAAGLLTMFIKQAMVGKQIQESSYSIIPPGEVLAGLNSALVNQELPNYQFVTACYAVIDTATGELTFARGGHPHPIHVSADGSCNEARTIGGLLGVFSEEEFPGLTLALNPGEKFIIYSDGLEDALICKRERTNGQVDFTDEFKQAVHLPAQELVNALTALLDRSEGSIEPRDDETCLVVERLS